MTLPWLTSVLVLDIVNEGDVGLVPVCLGVELSLGKGGPGGESQRGYADCDGGELHIGLICWAL